MLEFLKLAESIKSDRASLLSCIQYEVLENLPVQESYRRMCRKLGARFMSPENFEFWYWKYYHGDVDVETNLNEEVVESEPMNITELGATNLETILGYLNPIERIAARHVCTSFRSAVNCLSFDFQTLLIEPTRTNFRIRMDHREIQYNLAEDGCVIAYRDKKLKIKDAEFWNIAMQDVWALLEKRTPIQKLILSLKTKDTHLTDQFVETIRELRLEVEDFEMRTVKPEQVVTVLNVLTPGTLKKIKLVNPLKQGGEELARIAQTDQWRQAKSMDVHWLGVLEPSFIEHFYGFDSFVAQFEEVPLNVLGKLRDVIRLNETFQSCQLRTIETFDFSITSYHFPPFKDARFKITFGFTKTSVVITKIRRRGKK